MNSAELKEIGFKEWIKIKPREYEYNRDIILNLPKEQGVYVVRTTKFILRIKGHSDILYIGRGVIQRRIQALLRSHLPLNFRDYTNKHSAREAFERVLNELGLEIEISFMLTKDSKKAKDLESSLLRKFCQDHIEPPPLNNTRK
jgi:hypothetical protein